ncbi:toxin glutamine deamidase domain-containing protein [Nocardia sp. NPDC059240]|uniref:toxin glutamine deamidase domain-containing protein n=1 Tax=Nocardia sp. NPDC059240 TaxID=3346786 RepID=UPI0036859CAB
MTLTRPPVPGFLLDFLAGHWPEGDEDAMRRLADHWSTMSDSLQGLQQPAESTMNDALAAIDGRIHAAMTTYWQEIGGGDASELAKLVTICDSFAKQLEHGATDIEFAKLTIWTSLAAMVAMAFIPGVGEAVDLAAAAAVKLLIRKTILELIDRLALKGATFLAERVGLEVAAKLGTEAASTLTLSVAKNAVIGAGFGSTVDLTAQRVQVAMGNREQIDWGQVGTSAGAGALAGGVAGPIAEHVVAPAVGKKLDDFTTSVSDKVGAALGDKAAGVTTAAVTLTGQGITQIPANLIGNAAASTTLAAATGQPIEFTHIADGAGGGFLAKPHGGGTPGADIAPVGEVHPAPTPSALPAHNPPEPAVPSPGAHQADPSTLAASASTAAPPNSGTSLTPQPHSGTDPHLTPDTRMPAPDSSPNATPTPGSSAGPAATVGPAGPAGSPGSAAPVGPVSASTPATPHSAAGTPHPTTTSAPDRSPIPTSADRSPAAQPPDRAPAAQPVERAPAAQPPDRTPAPQPGDRAPAGSSSDRASAGPSSDRSAAVQSGDRAPAAQSGDRGPAVQTGRELGERGMPAPGHAISPTDRAVPTAALGERTPMSQSGDHASAVPSGDRASNLPAGAPHSSGNPPHPGASPAHPGPSPARGEGLSLPEPGHAADRYWPQLPVADKPYFANPDYHDPTVAHEYAQHHPATAEARDIRARNAATHPELARLSDPELDLIRRNQFMTLNEPLNRAARDGETALLAQHDLEMRALVNAYNKLPDHEGVVFRSLRIDDPTELARFLDYYDPKRPGPLTVDPGFASSDKISSMAGGNVELVIKSRSGKDISWASLNQDEVVFPPGTQFFVKSRSFEPGPNPYMDKYVINLIDLGRGHDAYQSGGNASDRFGEARPDFEAVQQQPRVSEGSRGDGSPQSGTERPGPPRTDRGTEEDLASLGRGGTAEDRTGDRPDHGVTPLSPPDPVAPHPTPDRTTPPVVSDHAVLNPLPDHVVLNPLPDHAVLNPLPDHLVPPPTPDHVLPQPLPPHQPEPTTPTPQPAPPIDPSPHPHNDAPGPDQPVPPHTPDASPNQPDAPWLRYRAPESTPPQPLHPPEPHPEPLPPQHNSADQPRPEPAPPHRTPADEPRPTPEHAPQQHDPQRSHPLESLLPSLPRESLNQAANARTWREWSRTQPPETGHPTPVRPELSPTSPPTFDFTRHPLTPNSHAAVVRIKVTVTHDGTVTPAHLERVWERAQLATDLTFNRGQKLLSGDTLVVDLAHTPDPTTANLNIHITTHPNSPWHPDAPLSAAARELRTHLGLDPSQHMAPLTHPELRLLSDDIAIANTPARFRGLDGTRTLGGGRLAGLEDPTYQHVVRDALRDGNRFLICADPRTNPYGTLVNDHGPHNPGRSNNCLDNALAAIASFYADPQVALPRWLDRLPGGGIDNKSGELNGLERAANFLGGKWQAFNESSPTVPGQFSDLHDYIKGLGEGSSALVVNEWHERGDNGQILYQADGSPKIDGSHATVVVFPHGAKEPVWWDPQSGMMSDHPPQVLVDRSASLRFMSVSPVEGGVHAGDPHAGAGGAVPGSDLSRPIGMVDAGVPVRLGLPDEAHTGGGGGRPGAGTDSAGGRFPDRDGIQLPELGSSNGGRGIHAPQGDRLPTDGRPDLPAPGARDHAPNPGDGGHDRVPDPNRIPDRTAHPDNGTPAHHQQTNPEVHANRLDVGERGVVGRVPESPGRDLAGPDDVRAVDVASPGDNVTGPGPGAVDLGRYLDRVDVREAIDQANRISDENPRGLIEIDGQRMRLGDAITVLMERNPDFVRTLIATPYLESALLKRPQALLSTLRQSEAMQIVTETVDEIRTRGPESVIAEHGDFSRPVPFPISEGQRELVTDIKQRISDLRLPVTQPDYREPRPPREQSESAYREYTTALERYRRDYLGRMSESWGSNQHHLNTLAARIAGETGELHSRTVPKDEVRVADKVNGKKYRGNPSRLTDLVGVYIRYDTVSDLYAGLEKLQTYIDATDENIRIVELKDRFEEPQGSGYGDVQMLVQLPSGHISEFRMHLKSMDDVAEYEHALYEIRRVLEPLAEEQGRPLTIDEQALYAQLEHRARQLYTEAFGRGSNG